MALLAAGIRWNLQYRVVFGGALANSQSLDPVLRSLPEKLRSATGGRVTLSVVGGNPSGEISDQSTFLATQKTMRVSLTVESREPISTQSIDTAFAEALKVANPSFSAQRIASAVPANGGCGAVDNFGVFQRGGYIARVCREHQAVGPGAAQNPAPVRTGVDNALASVSGATIEQSSNANAVGSPDTTVGDRIKRDPPWGDLWSDIPLTWKIGGGVLVGIAAFALIGYSVRSFRAGVG